MPTLIAVNTIWQGPSGSTVGYGGSLIRFHHQWFCNVRQRVPGEPSRTAGSGQEMVLTSPDGDEWRPVLTNAEQTFRGHDTFARLAVTPDNHLMMLGTIGHADPEKMQSAVSFSSDGHTWNEPTIIGDPGFPFWRINWNMSEGAAYAFAQKIEPGSGTRWRDDKIRLYRSDNGVDFKIVMDETAFTASTPATPDYVAHTFETAICFNPDNTCIALMRRQRGSDACGWKDAPPDIASRENREDWRNKSRNQWSEGHTGLLGISAPPYTEWRWAEVQRLAQPNLIRLPDGRIVAGGRAFEPKRVPLWEVDRNKMSMNELITLPSAGFVGYPGFALHDGKLWVVYHSAHETGIYKESNLYLARVEM